MRRFCEYKGVMWLEQVRHFVSLVRTGPCVGVVAADRRQGALFPWASALVPRRNVNIAAMQRGQTRFPPSRMRCVFVSVVLFKDVYPVRRQRCRLFGFSRCRRKDVIINKHYLLTDLWLWIVLPSRCMMPDHFNHKSIFFFSFFLMACVGCLL